MVILFDLDGTLLDSEQFARKARNLGFQAILGREVTKEEEAFFLGKPVRKVLAKWFPDCAEDLSKEIRSQYSLLSASIKPYTGVLDMLWKLKNKGCTLGIVSSKRNYTILQELKVTGLETFFDVIVGQDDTQNHKPDPEPLLLAASRLKVFPSRCIYIGDQPTDIMAAQNAGMGHIAAVWGEGNVGCMEKGIKTLLAHTPNDILTLIGID